MKDLHQQLQQSCAEAENWSWAFQYRGGSWLGRVLRLLVSVRNNGICFKKFVKVDLLGVIVVGWNVPTLFGVSVYCAGGHGWRSEAGLWLTMMALVLDLASQRRVARGLDSC